MVDTLSRTEPRCELRRALESVEKTRSLQVARLTDAGDAPIFHFHRSWRWIATPPRRLPVTWSASSGRSSGAAQEAPEIRNGGSEGRSRLEEARVRLRLLEATAHNATSRSILRFGILPPAHDRTADGPATPTHLRTTAHASRRPQRV